MQAYMGISNSEMMDITPRQFFLRWEIFNENRVREVKVLALQLKATSMGEGDLTDLVLELNEFLNDGPDSQKAKELFRRHKAMKEEQAIRYKTEEELQEAFRLHFPELQEK